MVKTLEPVVRSGVRSRPSGASGFVRGCPERSGMRRASPEGVDLEHLDQMLHAMQARITGGVSPIGVMNASLDWAAHLVNSPSKQLTLSKKAGESWLQLLNYSIPTGLRHPALPMARPDRRDPRFRSEDWEAWPFNALAQSFLLTQSWWREATRDVRGVTAQHTREVQFVTRQLLDFIAPSNFPLTNPEIARRTREEGGMNFLRGSQNLVEDLRRNWSGSLPEELDDYVVGRDVATTPGKVIFRNRLMKLIQYSPTTDKVWREPVLIIPAWIMKYYILDLSPHNSLVRYLVSRGHTVFMVSWKNPTADDRDLGMDDYRRLGVMAALDVIGKVRPGCAVHACGYCLGGTLLAIAAAAMGRDGDHRLASMTLLAAETDFSEAGELMMFVDESELVYLEDMMWAQGYMDPKVMSGAFRFLRASDLIWSRMVREYLLGDKDTHNDLMSWNADQTRLPYKMQSEYLRDIFFENRLAAGKYEVDGRPVALTDIEARIFAVGTIRDHIAPWKSVYKIKMLSDTDVTFVLAAGGHNAGIISEPHHHNRSYQIMTLKERANFKDPEAWRQQAPEHKGSWWKAWSKWLSHHSTTKVKPPKTGVPGRGGESLTDAPGTYVMGR